MKLHGALGNVEPRRDFLVREVLKYPFENLLLAAADSYPRPQGPARRQKLLGTLGGRVQKGFPGNYHQLKVLGRMAPHQTMHR